MDKDPLFTLDTSSTPDKLLVQLCFYFSVLMEYQLNDLQSEVREFVFAMSTAIQEMDNLVVEEGKSAQNLFESLFNQNKGEGAEASKINTRANKRAEEIFAEALSNLHPGQAPLETFNSDPNVKKENEATASVTTSMSTESPVASEATDKIWSDIAKKFESFCRLEERLRPQIYTMIQSLNFEDIQTQRIEHALNAQKRLNEGVTNFLKKGLNNCSIGEVMEFAKKLIEQTKASYTMTDERNVFDQVFIKPEEKKS